MADPQGQVAPKPRRPPPNVPKGPSVPWQPEQSAGFSGGFELRQRKSAENDFADFVKWNFSKVQTLLANLQTLANRETQNLVYRL